MTEKAIEKYLVKKTKEMGGRALKFVSPGFSGVPDRLVLMPKGKMCFAELKSQGKKPRPLQNGVHRMLRDLGFRVYVIDSYIGVEKMIKEITDG